MPERLKRVEARGAETVDLDAVDDVAEAETELNRLGVDYFVLDNVAAPELKQLFLRDPANNLVEIHQIGHCRCRKSQR